MYNPIDSFARITGFSFIPGVNWFRNKADFVKFLSSDDLKHGIFGKNLASCISHYGIDKGHEGYLCDGKMSVPVPSRLSVPLFEYIDNTTIILRSIAILIYNPASPENDALIIRLGDKFTVDFIFHTFSIITESELPRNYKVMLGTASIQTVDNYHQLDNLSEFVKQHHMANMTLTKMQEFYVGVNPLNIIDTNVSDSFSQLKSWVYYIPGNELAIAEKQSIPTIFISFDTDLINTDGGTLVSSEDIRDSVYGMFDQATQNVRDIIKEFDYACSCNLKYIGNTMLCTDISTVPSVFVVRDEIVFSSNQADALHWSRELNESEWKEELADYVNSEASFVDVYGINDDEFQIHLEFYRSHRAQQFIPTLPSEKMSEIVAMLPYPDLRGN